MQPIQNTVFHANAKHIANNKGNKFVHFLLITLLAFGSFVLLSTSAQADEYDAVRQLIIKNQNDQALVAIEEGLKAKPTEPQLRFLKGVVLSRTGKFDNAIVVFTELNRDYPELPEPYNNLAVLYASAGKIDEAQAALEAAIKNNPNYAIAYANLGDILLQKALQNYNKSLQLDAKQPELKARIDELGKSMQYASGKK